MNTFITSVATLAFASAMAIGASAHENKAGANHTAKASAHREARARLLTASGTIDSYDASTKTLTLKERNSDQSFSLEDAAKVQMGSKSMEISDLGSHKGARATVRYEEKEGRKVAESVRISGGTAKAHAKHASKPHASMKRY